MNRYKNEVRSNHPMLIPLTAIAAFGVLLLTPFYASEGALWTPSEITTHAWYDASNTGSISTSGTDVTQWNDLSGNAQHLTGVNAPQSGTRTLNGLNVIDGDGNDYLEDASFSTPSTIAIFQVIVYDAGGDARIAGMSMDNSNDWQLGFNDFRSDGIGATADTFASIVGSDANDAHVVSLTLDAGGSSTDIHIDGGNIHSTGYNGTLSATQIFRVLANRATNFVPDAAVGEVIIVTDVTEETRVLIEGYLAHKWGLEENLDSGHLYRDAAPTVVVPAPVPAALPAGLTMLTLAAMRRRRHRALRG